MLRSAIGGCLLALTASGVATAPPAHAETTIRAVMETELQVVDPITTVSYITRSFAYMVHDTLVAMDDEGRFHPQMLAGWERSEDGLRWRFTLRDGLVFSDGSAVTSADAVASIRRWGARDSIGRRLMAATASLDVVDAKRFELRLSRPFAMVIEALGKPSSNVPVIMPARLAATDPATAVTEVLGAGPFTFDRGEWRPGDRAVFRRNPRYVPRSEPPAGLAGGKVVRVDRVDWLSIPDGATKVAALLQGEVDFVQAVPPDFFPQLRRNRGIVVGREPGHAQTMAALRLNSTIPPFDNPIMRHAFQQVLDQGEFMAGLGLQPDMVTQCYSVFMCNAALSSDAGTASLRNPSLDRARSLLREAGYSGQRVVVFQSTDVPSLNAMALVLVDRLRQAGVNAEARATDWATVAQQRWIRRPIEEGGWSVMPGIWSGFDLSNPLTHAGIAFNCTDGYPGWSCDAEMSELLARFETEADAAKRRDIAQRIQERVHASVSMGLVGQFSNPPVYRRELEGVLTPGIPVFWNMSRVAAR